MNSQNARGIPMDATKVMEGDGSNSLFYPDRLSKFDEDWSGHFNESLYGSRDDWKKWMPTVFSPESIPQLSQLLHADRNVWMVTRARSLVVDQELLRLYRLAVVVAKMTEELVYIHAASDYGAPFPKIDTSDYLERCASLINELGLEEKRAVLKSSVKRCKEYRRLVEYLYNCEVDSLDFKAEEALTVARKVREISEQTLQLLLYFREFGGWLDGISLTIAKCTTAEAATLPNANHIDAVQKIVGGAKEEMLQVLFALVAQANDLAAGQAGLQRTTDNLGKDLNDVHQDLKSVGKMTTEALAKYYELLGDTGAKWAAVFARIRGNEKLKDYPKLVEILELKWQGTPHAEIGKKFGHTHSWVSKQLVKAADLCPALKHVSWWRVERNKGGGSPRRTHDGTNAEQSVPTP